MEVGDEGERLLYLSLHCHHQYDSCIKMGSDESHFNVSVGSDGQNHKTVSTNLNHGSGRYKCSFIPLSTRELNQHMQSQRSASGANS